MFTTGRISPAVNQSTVAIMHSGQIDAVPLRLAHASPVKQLPKNLISAQRCKAQNRPNDSFSTVRTFPSARRPQL